MQVKDLCAIQKKKCIFKMASVTVTYLHQAVSKLRTLNSLFFDKYSSAKYSVIPSKIIIFVVLRSKRLQTNIVFLVRLKTHLILNLIKVFSPSSLPIPNYIGFGFQSNWIKLNISIFHETTAYPTQLELRNTIPPNNLNVLFFSEILPEALRTKCVRCTERQKRTAVKVIKRLKYEYPDEWAKVSSRWDPTGDFTRYFEEFLAKEHFNSIPGSGNIPYVSKVYLCYCFVSNTKQFVIDE